MLQYNIQLWSRFTQARAESRKWIGRFAQPSRTVGASSPDRAAPNGCRCRSLRPRFSKDDPWAASRLGGHGDRRVRAARLRRGRRAFAQLLRRRMPDAAGGPAAGAALGRVDLGALGRRSAGAARNQGPALPGGAWLPSGSRPVALSAGLRSADRGAAKPLCLRARPSRRTGCGGAADRRDGTRGCRRSSRPAHCATLVLRLAWQRRAMGPHPSRCAARRAAPHDGAANPSLGEDLGDAP